MRGYNLMLVVMTLAGFIVGLGIDNKSVAVHAQNSGYLAIVPNNKDGSCPSNSVALQPYFSEGDTVGTAYLSGQDVLNSATEPLAIPVRRDLPLEVAVCIAK